MRLFKDVLLTPVPEVEPYRADLPVQDTESTTFSTETYTATEAPPDACGQSARRGMRFMFTREENDDKENPSSHWTFFLNGTVNLIICNNLITKLCQVGRSDTVHIHGPSDINIDMAEILASAMSVCNAANITYTAPFITSLPAAYLVTYADIMTNSECGLMMVCYPFAVIGGRNIDVKCGMAYEHNRRVYMVNRLTAAGFISNEAAQHIVEKQGIVSIYGSKLGAAITNFNNRTK